MTRPAAMSTRVRITLTTVGLLVAALVAFGVGLAALYRVRQEHAVERVARAQAAAVVSLARRGPLPKLLPALGPGPFTLVQVVDARGDVIAATSGLDNRPPVVGADHLGRRTHTDVARFPFTSTTQRGVVETVPIGLNGEPATVIVVESTADNQRGEATLISGLIVGLPLVGLLGALLAWTATGRALRPVEAMRRQAADITARDLHMRVPTPPGHDDIARLATTLNEMLVRLDNAVTEQRRFVADASHELRSPVSNIRTALEVSIDAEPSDAHRQVLDRVLAEVRRLESLLDQLLVLARADEARPRTHVHSVDFSDLVRDESHRFERRGVTVTGNIADGITVEGNADLLLRVIRNLFSNAMRYADAAIIVELSAETDGVRLVVTDDGPGIPLTDRERVFGRFVRLDDHRARPAGGTGLGLAIARDAVVAHGGAIRLDDSDKGASFVVTLPRAQS
jgi:signal transduction histidine kinase